VQSKAVRTKGTATKNRPPGLPCGRFLAAAWLWLSRNHPAVPPGTRAGARLRERGQHAPFVSLAEH
jgi:hypothetical protein